ncbi:MAG: hypothetical protein C7B45_07790 [Sulfobacillus acidophilus]|uniref:Uncharacterized protein n=1 Tax=Sulfobacillus acidophilus TaxID=53633 RepID=A0A2T2WJ42_9FIRM|nr:MAG: hypothetical protein C7B45_07790 [Sulfobacillus acidophilus]
MASGLNLQAAVQTARLLVIGTRDTLVARFFIPASARLFAIVETSRQVKPAEHTDDSGSGKDEITLRHGHGALVAVLCMLVLKRKASQSSHSRDRS